MTFGERLVYARENNGMNQKQLAEALEITPTRLNYWEKDKRQPDVPMIRRLAEVLEVSADYLIGLEAKNGPSGEALTIANKYDALPRKGREAVKAVVDIFEDVVAAAPTKVIPLIVQAFAAGSGEPDFGDISLDTYEAPAGSQAEFACRVHGDSLEPYLRDQDVALAVKRPPHDGEVGVWLVDGEYKIKQYASDPYGNVYLFAVNRDRADTDQTLFAHEEHTVYCLGTILLGRRLPLP